MSTKRFGSSGFLILRVSGARHVRHRFDRKSRRNCLPRHPYLEADGYSLGRRLLGSRSSLAARARGRRCDSHRARAGQAELPRRRRGARGGSQELLASLDEAQSEAARIGFPVMLKSSAGGGGIGMSLCRSAAELAAAYETVKRLSQNNFGDASVYLERFVERARHIEVQLFGDGRGDVIALGERDCSAQRRNQKVIEETPAPNLEPSLRRALHEAAVVLGKS